MSEAASLRVCGWARFQHYRDRNPPWIKLYNDLLDNRDYRELDPFCKALLIDIWLLASENKKEDGCVRMDGETLAWRLRLDTTQVAEALDSLEEAGFVEALQDDASDVLADCLQDATPEREGETERETERDTKLEEGVREVFTLCCELRISRTGKKGGPALQLTNGRASKIRARLREGFTVDDLKDCTRGFYADTWPDRDRYLDPKYAFKDDDTVRRFIDQHRNGPRNGGGPQYQPRRGYENVAR
jgi:hypothetical protein